jgi:ABC-2 type transport system permease protein
MVWAETLKVFTRGSGIAALAIALLVGVFTVGAVYGAKHSGMQLNGADASEVIKVTGVQVAGYALTVRNFFVLPMFLLLAAASAVAGEYGDRTLRELVVRPVPRWSILAAKLVALTLLSLTTLVLTLVPALGLGLALFGTTLDGETTPSVISLLGGYGATLLSDVGLHALGMLASLFLTSVGGVVVGVVMLLLGDLGLRGVLFAAGQLGVKAAEALVPWTLGNALACWKGWESGWNPSQFGALAAWTAISLAAAIATFRRIDVP